MASTRLTVHVAGNQYWIEQFESPEDPENAVITNVIQVDSHLHAASIFTGMNNGDLPVTVSVLDHRPDVQTGDWHAVVEVSMVFSAPVHLTEIVSEWSSGVLPIAYSQDGISYRLRIHARGQREGVERDSVKEGDEDYPVEEHLIQIWPAPITAETVYKDLNPYAG